MLKVFEKAPFPVKAMVNAGVYELTLTFPEETDSGEPAGPSSS